MLRDIYEVNKKLFEDGHKLYSERMKIATVQFAF